MRRRSSSSRFAADPHDELISARPPVLCQIAVVDVGRPCPSVPKPATGLVVVPRKAAQSRRGCRPGCGWVVIANWVVRKKSSGRTGLSSTRWGRRFIPQRPWLGQRRTDTCDYNSDLSANSPYAQRIVTRGGRTPPLSPRCPSLALDNHTSLKIKWALTSTFAVELRGLEPLTSSMPSTVGLCGGPALRQAIGHPRPPLTATVRADW
jgi:hypothetical protein